MQGLNNFRVNGGKKVKTNRLDLIRCVSIGLKEIYTLNLSDSSSNKNQTIRIGKLLSFMELALLVTINYSFGLQNPRKHVIIYYVRLVINVSHTVDQG